MMNFASNYRTKTLFQEKNNGVVMKKNGLPGYPMGIDIGYGGVKLYAPNICATFPSYAKQIDLKSFIEEFTTDDILYTDLKTGLTWLVGRSAQNAVQLSDTSDTIEALCGRNRYYSPMFKVLLETSLGISLMDTANVHNYLQEGQVPYITTGLPCQYIEADAPFLKDAFAGKHDFRIQIGQTTPKEFHLDIPMSNIQIIKQPMGAYISATTDINWNQSHGLKTVRTLIFDPGFKTLDTFSVRGGNVDSKESWQDLGMSRILQEVSKQILSDFGMDIPPAHMQKYLETGEFPCVDRKARRSAKVDFSYILEAKSKEICNIALDRAFEMYDYFTDYDCFVLAGGTGAAWKDWIKEGLSGISALRVIADDTPDGMPMYFANSRGYYEFCRMWIASLT